MRHKTYDLIGDLLAHDLAGKVNYLMQQVKALREKQDQRQGMLVLEDQS